MPTATVGRDGSREDEHAEGHRGRTRRDPTRIGWASTLARNLGRPAEPDAATAGADEGEAQPGTQENASKGSKRDRPPARSRPLAAKTRADPWRRQSAAHSAAALATYCLASPWRGRDRRAFEREMARAARENGIPLDILYSVGLTETGRPAR